MFAFLPLLILADGVQHLGGLFWSHFLLLLLAWLRSLLLLLVLPAAGRLLLLLLVLTVLLLFVLLYRPVMRREEKELGDEYGKDYLIYRERVSLFLPGKPLPVSGDEAARFSWIRVWENREHNAVLGYLVVSLFLCLKL